MHFTFQYIRGEAIDDILFNPARNKWFEQFLTIQDVSQLNLLNNEKARSTYVIGMAHKYIPEDVFRGNRVIVVVDRRAPADPEIRDNYWSNIIRAEAIACDAGITAYLKESAPFFDKRVLNLTGVAVGRSTKLAVRPKGSRRCVFVGDREHPLWVNMCESKEADREDIEWHTSSFEKLGAYGVYVTPHAHSQLYLTALASRCSMLIHPVNFEASYNLDPRTNSISLGRMIGIIDAAMLGSTGFTSVRDMFYGDLSGIIESLDVNYYMTPVGDTLFDRLFVEINKSSFE